MKTYFYAASIILALAGSVQAGPFQYECTIERMYKDDGSSVDGLLKMYQDNKVYIERDTGLITHPYWVTQRSDVASLAVLHKGDASTYYKSITHTVAGIMIAVTVKEFAQGNKKPMALVENGKVMTGYCY